MQQGTVYWITGLAGAGKTTIGRLLYDRLKQEKDNVIFFDGDLLRDIFPCGGYSYQARLDSCWPCNKMACMLAKQGMDIVFCTISMFHEVQSWNKENFPGYKEIYLNVPMQVLRERDQKGLYSGAEQGLIKEVVGIDIPMEAPKNPDIEIMNDGRYTPTEIIEFILKKI